MATRRWGATAVAVVTAVVLLATRSYHAPTVAPAAPIQRARSASAVVAIAPAPVPSSDGALARAFAQHAGHIEVEDSAEVVKVLGDDDEGSRHQRFIVRLASGQTLLIAHNIDLAPRLPGLRAGDLVRFHGEYAWTPQGGVVHWTHADPRGRHETGWIRPGP